MNFRKATFFAASSALRGVNFSSARREFGGKNESMKIFKFNFTKR